MYSPRKKDHAGSGAGAGGETAMLREMHRIVIHLESGPSPGWELKRGDIRRESKEGLAQNIIYHAGTEVLVEDTLSTPGPERFECLTLLPRGR